MFYHKSDGFLHAYLMLLFPIPRLAGTRWPKGLAYNNGGLHSSSSQCNGGCSRPHPLPVGGGDFSSVRPGTEEGASQGAQSCKAYISSRFAFPTMWSFPVVLCFTGC